ncbi:ABC transporter permease [Extibacter muris]|uniref:ABC transporter permease n=1 Tax=Extibacter muris TaxID=1796622 RepID=A0A4V2WSI6_9FIRM|nr:ABC transporter permease [Extibacter muris]MCU0078046.1 ABC transporter permease [Extibacter muris]TDA21740.1 ABC transporter permease [Extibacter muris]
MSFSLECKKVKRTGFTPAFLFGGLLAAVVPVLNMAVRSENYLGIHAAPVQILLDANWQMMAMLNILLIVAGACLMYHTEYADNAIQKMCTLPIKESKLFFGKVTLMLLMCIVVLVIEAASIAFCSCHWFEMTSEVWIEVMKNFGYALLLMLPSALGSLFIASVCKNMWVSLGIGVVCVFTATMLPTRSFVLSLFPFALPFQIFAGTAENTACNFMIAAVVEIIIIGIAEVLFLKVRRSFE